MSLPAAVIEYLQDDFVAESQPFCLLIDERYHLLDTWGDGSWTGLDRMPAGADMIDQAPFLHGTLGETPQKLNFVSTGDGLVVHVVTIPADGKHYVVLLDAGQAHDFLRERQQHANELRLLHASQQKLIARQRDLISDLVEAKTELDHHRREAERSSASKSRFIAMMSHEFRTPLASIINYADLALEGDSGMMEARKSVEAIERSARHLVSLVEAVLDEAQLGAGKVELRARDFDLYDLLDDLAAMMAPLAAEKGLAFATLVDGDVPRAIRADDVCLRQVLINLLGNAVKFTIKGSIRLHVSYVNGRVIASVSDTGPGISPDDQERIFRAFERGPREGASGRGAGLGLTISLRLAKLMGGEISLDSRSGGGCTVSLHVPVEAAKPAEKAVVLEPPGQDAYATEVVTVLVCDDDEDIQALLEHYLHRSGYGLVTASNTVEAIDKGMRLQPDIVLMDVNLGGQSGTETARALRDRGFEGPIVALTASRLSDDEKSLFTCCFRKPAAMPELLGTIKALTHAT